MNGWQTLLYKEVLRFWKVSFQTVAAPVLTALLYLVIFGHVLSDRVKVYDQISYTAFLVPGLVMMSVLQNAFANSSSSLIQSKITGNLVFVLLTPRNWFRDLPEGGGPGAAGQVQLLSKEGNRQIYRVDARILAPPKFALQSDLHSALQQALPELHNGNFSISKIEPLRDDQGMVIAYQVEIRH